MPPCSDPITNGNLEAQDFVRVYGEYTRQLDNFVDGEHSSPEALPNIFSLAVRCYSHPFYRRHPVQLQVAILTTTSLWAVSVLWERQPELWKRTWADVLRHADVNLMIAISLICNNGFESAQKVSRIFLATSFIDHSIRHGQPH
jgi:hypothetical protein